MPEVSAEQGLEKPFELSEFETARSELAQFLPPTPLVRNAWLSEIFGADIYLKLETTQPICSFKIRGASYRISRLGAEARKQGVVAASAGNHAQGVAWGSRKYGLKATIVMPKSAPITKIQNTKALGAEVKLFGENYDEAYAHAQALSQELGKTYVHAFQDRDVILGQGSCGFEILEQLPDVDAVVCAIGGGGFLAGIASVISKKKLGVKFYGCQAAGAASMARAFEEGKPVALERVDTFADGIKVKTASAPMYRLLKSLIEPKILTAGEEEIASALHTFLEKAKILAEGAAAVSLACLPQIKDQIKGKKVVLVVGGGNIDVNLLNRIIDRGLIEAGRRLRINLWISDRPGTLAFLTDMLAKSGANIVQVIHDRSEPSTTIDQTEVNLTLETRGPEHSEALIAELRSAFPRVQVLA